MESISLNGNWKCKSNIENLGIKKEWFLFENYNMIENNLIEIEIPKSYNLLQGFENFEGQEYKNIGNAFMDYIFSIVIFYIHTIN